MTKKIFIGIGVLVILFFVFVSFMFVNLYLTDKENEKLISQCENTNYNVKRLDNKKVYLLKNDPNQNKLSIKIDKSSLYVDSGDEPIVSKSPNIFGSNGIFNSCSLKQAITYQLIFNNQLTTKIDEKGDIVDIYAFDGQPKVASAFDRVLEFPIEKDNLSNSTLEYSFEDNFMDRFKIITKNNLTLYSEELIINDKDIIGNIFFVEGDFIVFVETPEDIRSGDFGIANFEKKGDKMEITFTSKNTIISKTLCFEKLDIQKFVQTGKIWKNRYNQLNLNSLAYIPCQNR